MARKETKLPDLYNRDSKGKLRVRKSCVYGTDKHAYWEVFTGVDGGKLIQTLTEYTEGKGGRTAYEQAELEQAAKNKVKIDAEKYVVDKAAAAHESEAELPTPVLCSEYKAMQSKIKYPLYVQPKLDGNRSLWRVNGDGSVMGWSRRGNIFKGLDHITKELARAASVWYEDWRMEIPLIFDGELFTWAMPFENINGTLKSADVDPSSLEEGSADREAAERHAQARGKIQLWTFDLLLKDEPFSDRIALLNNLGKALNFPVGSLTCNNPIVRVPTLPIVDEGTLDELHGSFVEEGYEGTILRSYEGLYKSGARNKDLVKRKDLDDAEFTVISVIENERAVGTAKFRLREADGVEFDANPKCSYDKRRDILAHADDWIGKTVTAQFNGRYKNKIPKFARVIRIRDEI
jgi:ATP-dependent DNA ligase